MTPRWLHPGAWWIWALGLAAAASRTTNPLLLCLILAVVALVVAARKPATPWARSFGAFLKLGLVVIAVRVAFQVIFGAATGLTVLFTLPSIALPEWMAGVRIGGDVTAEGLLIGLYDGLRLAVLLACIGAANSLASPSRLLKSVPAALYEVGVALVIALTFAPMLVTDIDRVRQAQRLRGRPHRGLRAIAASAIPVFEGALDRSVSLAAAMDSRGYGRTAHVPATRRRAVSLLLLAGLVAIGIGAYGLLAGGGRTPWMGAPLGLAGVVAAVIALRLAGARSLRTRYRPDPWRWQEWFVSLSGVLAGVTVAWAAGSGLPGMSPPVIPPGWPDLPALPALMVLLAAAPAVVAPPIPRSRTRVAPSPTRIPEAVGA